MHINYTGNILTSGCSFTGTYTFSVSVVTMPSASGRTSGSFLTPFIWNKLALTFAISEKKKRGVSGAKHHHISYISTLRQVNRL